MTNKDLINEAIAVLQSTRNEDCAQAIDDLRNELERVKDIASRRLDKINALQLELAQLEDDPRRLEDSDDEFEDRELADMKEQRDEARRDACWQYAKRNGKGYLKAERSLAEQYALINRWDCFKKGSDA